MGRHRVEARPTPRLGRPARLGPEHTGLGPGLLAAKRPRNLDAGQLAQLSAAGLGHRTVVGAAGDLRLGRHPRDPRVPGTVAGVPLDLGGGALVGLRPNHLARPDRARRARPWGHPLAAKPIRLMSRLTMTDRSPRSRTSNRCSGSPGATLRGSESGKCLTAGWAGMTKRNRSAVE